MRRMLSVGLFCVLAVALGLFTAGCGTPSSPAKVGTPDKMGGDKMGGDKMGGDKMGGDKMAGDKMASDKMSGDKMASDKMDKK
jgi:pentapeptide MXKDX repeat protein